MQRTLAATQSAPAQLTEPRRRGRSLLGRLVLHLAFVAIAIVAYAAHEHFRLAGDSTAALASLVAAIGFGLAPVRAVVHAVFAVERRVLHLAHGAGALALVGLTAGGVISGGPILDRAAMAPFAIMGAAQALMHQDHPRNPEQAAALRRFATSLPELRAVTSGRELRSPEDARRAAAVLTDLIAKAQALGETELRADPGFQGALHQATARFGLTLGLDVADQAIARLAESPGGAAAAPELRRRLAAARKALGEQTRSDRASPGPASAGSRR
jgi:hypothetical protein